MSYSAAHLQLCRQDDLLTHYAPFTESSDKFADSAVGEPRQVLYPTQLHPRRIFARQNSEGNIRPLNPRLFTSHHQIYQPVQSFTNVPPHQLHQWPQDSQSWSPQSHSVPVSLKQATPFPQSRLSPSTFHHTKRTSPGGGFTAQSNRIAFTESVDPSTGLVFRTPEHPRLRTAQACQKCRLRKAKCSGEHPTCERCMTRGLVCEYAKEGRVRGPNKPKGKSSGTSGDASTGNDHPASTHYERSGTRPRTSSSTSSSGSSGDNDFSPVRHFLEGSDLKLDQNAAGGDVVGPSRRSSFSVDDFTPGHSCAEIASESKGFRRPATARTLKGDYLFLPSELTPCNGGQVGIDHQHNSLMTQENFGFSSSVTIRRRHRESTSLQLPTDHPLFFQGMSHSELIPVGFDHTYTGPHPDSIKSQDMPAHTVSFHEEQDHVSSSFGGSLSSSCGSPTASSIASPLTPNSTPTSMSLLPNILDHISHPSQEGKFNSSSGLNYHFGLETATSSNSLSHLRLRPERENAYGYHSTMDISIF